MRSRRLWSSRSTCARGWTCSLRRCARAHRVALTYRSASRRTRPDGRNAIGQARERAAGEPQHHRANRFRDAGILERAAGQGGRKCVRSRTNRRRLRLMLWMIRDGTPVPLKLFTPDEAGRAMVANVEIPMSTSRITLLAVTEESSQGAVAPTMTPFLAGEVAARPATRSARQTRPTCCAPCRGRRPRRSTGPSPTWRLVRAAKTSGWRLRPARRAVPAHASPARPAWPAPTT